MNLTNITEVLDTYQGRDKFLRLFAYLGKLGTGIIPYNDVAVKSQIFSSQISGCRVILRLLDDIPTLHSIASYGWGKEEPDRLIRWANLLQNLVDIIFCPLEHICWAGEKKILSVNVSLLDNATTWCWLISIYLSLVKSVRRINQLQKHKACLQRTACDVSIALRPLKAQQINEFWTCLRLVLDLSYAINYLPPDTLWGGKLNTWQVGALGTISSLIILCQMFRKHAVSKK
ncbi:peroxisomal membrane protein 11C [Athalia rosae]|uniref:peroxisomal membrane protein 11C n=1 Tax=Athalia rosae TaxID=37344 RepID=UPI0020339D82|nr:peroxisomal membrane protein 11C [Athalia rosae]